MKTSPRIRDFDANGYAKSAPLLPVPARLVASDVRDDAAHSWNRRVRNWMQS